MDLSNDLISKFVKITNDGDKKKTKEGTVYGTAVKYDGSIYVKIDGSDLLTPIDTTADIKEGERVTIMIKDHNATVTGNITSPSASSADVKKVTRNVEEIEGEITEFEAIIADVVHVGELDAEVARIDELIAGKATIEDLTVTNAEITNLKAKDAEIENLVADKADITYLDANFATIDELEATHANIEVLDAEVASINTLVNGNLTSDNILSFNITSKNTTMEDAFIKDAMIDRITANKIMSGTIDTNNVTIQSTDGSMLLQGTLLQMKDDNGKVRIQIGKDTGGNFTFVLYDETGKGVLIDEEGIKSSDAIADGLIVDAKVADNANISGSKLDIASVITEVNNDNSTTIKSSKIYLNEQNQSLEVAFNSLKSQVETIQDVTIDGDLSSIVEQVQSNTTKIEANKEGINTLVAENVIRTEEISNLEGELQQVNTTLSNKYASLEQNINGFKTTVSDTYTTKTEFNTLNIGSTNLVAGTKDFSSGWAYHTYYMTKTNETAIDSRFTGMSISFTPSTAGDDYADLGKTKCVWLEPDTEYTLSFWAKGTGKFYTYLWGTSVGPVASHYNSSGYSGTQNDGSSIHTLSSNDTFKRYWVVYKTKSTTQGSYNLVATRVAKNLNTDVSMIIYGVKFEKGNKPTDWSPAPEDVQANIDAVDGKFANYSTTTQMNSAINQKAKEITSSVSSTYTTKTEFNNLEVGGRNYVLSSNTEKSTPDYTYVIYDISTKAQTELQGKEVTISFEAKKTSGTADMYAYLRDPSIGYISPASDSIGDITTSYKRYSVTFTAPSDLSRASQIGINSTSVVGLYVRNVKLEKGNMPTDWSPAPEDVQSQIDTINTNLTTYATKSELTQTNNSIVAKFSESGGYNLIRNSTGAGGNANGWTHSGTSMGVGSNDLIGSANRYYIYLDNGTTTTERYAYSSRFKLKPNTTYRFTGYFHNYTKCPSFDVFVLSSTSLPDTDTTTGYTNAHNLIQGASTNNSWKKFTTTFTTPEGTSSGILRIDNNGYNQSGSYSNKVQWNCLILTEGEIEVPWSPHPSEIYDGITKIDKNGLQVSQSNYNGYTRMKADGFYVNNGSENVISITKDGSYFKGKVVVTNGSAVPTSVLSGTILSGQLDSTITSDISTAKTNASTAKSTAESVKTTVDSGKTNWNNAYSRVNEWAYGAVTGSTTIDGGYIQTNTIVSDKIAAGAIIAAKIAAGAVTADKISAGAITADKLAANAITSKTITGSTITGGTISGATITSETLMKTYGGMYVGSEIWGGFKKDSNGNYSSAQTFTIRGSKVLQIDGNPTRISSVTGEVKIGDASSYDNLRAREIYAQEIIYTNDLRTRDAAQLSLSNVSMRSANAFIDFSSGYGVIRVTDRNHLYLQTKGNTGGDTSAEIRCTRYADASNYVNIRAYNVCAQNAVYANGVNVSSDINRKRDIELYSTDALQEVCSTPVYAYHLDTDKDEELKRIGIIMQEAPLDAIDLTGKGVDLYQMVTMLWKATQQQQEMIEELKRQLKGE